MKKYLAVIVVSSFVLFKLVSCESPKEATSLPPQNSAFITPPQIAQAYKNEEGADIIAEKQKTTEEIETIKDGISKNDLKARLALFRNRYKECEKGKIVKGTGKYKINVQGLDLLFNNQKVVGLGSLDLTPSTLSAITQKVTIIDDILYQNCIDLGREYAQINPNADIIMLLINKKYDWQNKMIQVIDNIKESAIKENPDQGIQNSIDTIGKKETGTKPAVSK